MSAFTLLTGASAGLGRALAARLPGPLLLQGRDLDRLRETLRLSPPGSQVLPGDLRATLPLPGTFASLPLAGIVHAAGWVEVKASRLWQEAQLRELFDVHLLALAGLVGRGLREGWLSSRARLTLVSSAAARLGDAGNAPYAAAKAALEAMARCWRAEGLDVSVAVPGLFLSPMGQRFTADPAAKARLDFVHPLGIGETDAVADAVAALHRREWRVPELVVDGGRVIRQWNGEPRPLA